MWPEAGEEERKERDPVVVIPGLDFNVSATGRRDSRLSNHRGSETEWVGCLIVASDGGGCPLRQIHRFSAHSIDKT